MAELIIPGLESVEGLTQDNFVRCAKTMLKASASASGYDLFADLLDSNAMLNTGASSGYTLSGGKIIRSSTEHNLGYGSYDAHAALIGSTTYDKTGQTFLMHATDTKITKIGVMLRKVGSPTDAVKCSIYSVDSGLPSAELYTSSNTVSNASIGEGSSYFEFTFTNAIVSANTNYSFVLERTGSLDASNNYYASYISYSAYDNGAWVRHTNGSTWAIVAADLYFTVFTEANNPATVVWTAKTLIEAAEYGLVSADATLGTGDITYYLSDDDTNWTEITALDTVQALNFDATSLSLKAVITGNAELRGVAWGSY